MNWIDVWNFLREYGSYFLEVISLIFVIIIGIKKKSITVGEVPWTQALLLLPGYINEAEESGYKGDGKLQYVVAKILDYLSGYYGNIVFGDKALIRKIVAAIEDILSTPTKK